MSASVASDTNSETQLKSEQLSILYAGIPVSSITTFIVASVLVTVEWNVVDHTFALGWLIVLYLLTFARLAMSLAYRKAGPESVSKPYWETYFHFGAIGAGVLWGSTAFFLFPASSMVHQVFLLFVVGGMCAGAITSLSALLIPVFGFVLAALIPLIIQIFMQNSEVGYAMSGLALLYLITISANAFRNYHTIRENISLRIQSQLNEEEISMATQRHALHEAQTDVGIIEWNPDFTVRSWNHGAEKIFGFDARDAVGKTAVELIIPESAQPHVKQIWQDLLNQKGGQHSINENITLNGKIITCEWHNTPLIEANGNVAGVFSLVNDISVRMRKEYLTKQSSVILEMVASGEATTRIYDEICRSYEDIHPGVKTSILKLKGNQLFHCSAPSLPDAYCKAIDGGEIGPCAGSCGTAAFLGEEVIVEDIASDPLWQDYKELALAHKLRACWSVPVKGDDGQVLATFAMYFNHPNSPSEEEIQEIRDASKLVSIVMQREQREAMLNIFSQVIEQAGEYIMITDKQGCIEYVNPAFTKITGYEKEEVLGENPRILKSGSQSEAFYEKLWATITSGKTWSSSIVDKRKDGSRYPSLISIAPIFNDGKITHYASIHQDMSDYKALEEQFHQAQKMEAIGTLVGGIAHDFNNILAGMVGNLYLARKKAENHPDVIEKLEKVEKLNFRASAMIKQLLAFARKDTMEMHPFGFTTFMREVRTLSTVSIPESIDFQSRICAHELVVKGDTNQLQQVLMNLLNNARDAVQDVAKPVISLEIESFEAGDDFVTRHPDLTGRLFAHVTVKDNGTGISYEDKERIFEPFYTTKKVGEGTGLGLAMSYGAIQSHGGALEVESSPGNGSIFHIYLPVIEEKKIDIESAKSTEVVSGHGELILIVDDNADVRITGKDVLESINYKVLEASDGLDAVDVFTANQNDISLVIMDIVMPRLGGVQAARRIKKICPDTKVIFATGYDKDQTLNDEMPSSDYTVISKLYNIVELSRMIREHIDS